MSRQILITDADTAVDVRVGRGGEPARVRFGDDPYGVTFVGDLTQLQRLIIEADRQIAQLRTRSSGPATQ
jgi:hypothetical protein